MTVFGGLQYCSFVIIDFSLLCFNTDDGIRRATMYAALSDLNAFAVSFNTDDGIRRATMFGILYDPQYL